VPLETAASLVALRSAAGLASLVVGPLIDRYRRRTLILTAVVLFTLGALLAAALPVYTVFAIALIMMGLAKVILDPTTITYISDRVPYAQRARITGLFELAWSLAALVGIPLAGWAIARYGWQSPYWGLVGLGLFSLLAVAWGFPSSDIRRHPAPGRLLGSYSAAIGVSSVRWLWPTLLCITLANELVFIVYGAWLESQYGLGAAALGTVSIATGLAELAGEGISSAFLDRFGKKRGILVGLVGMMVAYPLLPALGNLGVAGAVAGLVLLLLVFEFTIISTIPLATELAPTVRATTLSLNTTGMLVGRVLGGLLGPLLWTAAGLWGNAWAAFALTLAAFALLALRVHENVKREA
jgi:predicted MFS family arabinose efflux permease